MRHYHRLGVLTAATADPAPAARVTVSHRLLSRAWTADVETIEAAISRAQEDAPSVNPCEVSFFEIEGDPHLHVNVTHPYLTESVAGWAGPGRISEGFVHNRRFADMPPARMIRHILEMVSAPRA